MTTKRALARAAVAIGAVTAASRVVGFLRVAVFAHTVGATPLGDTYQTANTLPNIVFEVVAGGALAAAVVPVIATTVGDRERTRQTAAALLTWSVLLLTPVAIVGAFAGRSLMTLLAGGTTDTVLRHAKIGVGGRMLVVFMPQVVLYGLGVVATGVLHAHRKFVAAALAPLLASVVVIGCYLTYALTTDHRGDLLRLTRSEELVLAAGTTAGVAVMTLVVLVPLARLRLGLRPTLSLPPDTSRQVRNLASSAVASVVAQQIALAVILRLCNVEPGAVVVYQIAYTVFLLPYAVLAVPVATSAFPALAAADDAEYARLVAGTLRSVIVVSGLAAAVLAAVAWPVSRLVAGAQPGVNAAPPDALPHAIVAFAPGLVGYGVLALLTRALYARHRARAVAAATITGFATTAVLAVVLVSIVDERVTAIGIAHSIGMTVSGALLVRAVR